MAEIPLITIDNVRAYSDLQPLYDQERFDSYVMRVQRNNLRELLGRELYYDMFQKVSTIDSITGPYDDLINGEIYELNGDNIEYYGIKPFICYHVLVLLINESNLFLTDTGLQTFESNLYKNAVRKDVRNDMFAEAERYGNEIIQYLDENSSFFPLWDGNGLNNPINSSFMIY